MEAAANLSRKWMREYLSHGNLLNKVSTGGQFFHRSLSGLSDEQLAAEAGRGDEDHFRTLVSRYSASFYRTAYRMIGNREEAEDVVQEAFLKIFRSLNRVDLNRLVKPWLFKILVNTALSHLRGKKITIELSAEQAENMIDGGDHQATATSRIDLETAILRLPLEYRHVLVLRAIEDLTFSEISQSLDMPEATARTRFSRGKALLKKLL